MSQNLICRNIGGKSEVPKARLFEVSGGVRGNGVQIRAEGISIALMVVRLSMDPEFRSPTVRGCITFFTQDNYEILKSPENVCSRLQVQGEGTVV